MRNDIPNDNASNFGARVRETLMTYLGKQGDPLDRGVTLRDLVDSGFASLSNLRFGGGSAPLVAGTAITESYVSDLTPPPIPTGFTANAAISNIVIECDDPNYTQGHGHLRSHVYGATRTGNAAQPVFADAVEITQFAGAVTSYSTNPATEWHLWIKWESVDGVLSVSPAGGTNGVVVTTGQDVSKLLSALTGKLKSEQLYADLGARINLIDASATTVNSVAWQVAQEAAARATAITNETNARTAAISAEATSRANALTNEASARAQAILDEAAARATADSSLQTQINTLSAASSGDLGTLIAAVQEEQTARANADTAEATARSTLATQLRGAYEGSDPSVLSTGIIYNERQTRITAEGAISSTVSALTSTVNNNYTTLNSAIVSEQTTRANADTALTTSFNSLSATVGTKTRTFSQATAPTATATGDIWFDTSDGNKAHRWNGTAWAATDDTRIANSAAAITAEQTARATADTALATSITQLTSTVTTNKDSMDASVTTLNSAITSEASTRASADTTLTNSINTLTSTVTNNYTTLNAAITNEASTRASADTAAASTVTALTSTVNTKNRTFNQSTTPTATATGDLWFDTGNGNKAYRWDGTTWVATDDTRIAANTAAITSEANTRATADTALSNTISTLSATVTGNYNTLNAAITSEATTRANADSAVSSTLSTVSATASSKNRTFYEAAAPTASAVGDLWFKTSDNNKAFRWDGTNWVATDDARIAANAAAIVTEQTARADAVSALANTVSTLGTTVTNNNNTLTAAIASEATARSGADSSLATSISTLTSTVNNNNANLTSAIQTEATTRADAVTTLSNSITTLQSTVNGNTAAISTESATRASVDGGLLAQYTVKTDLNGYVSGFGLASTLNNGTPSSTFAIRADAFYIASPTGPGVTPTMPFIVRTSPTVINGETIPAGVYITDGYIQNGTITNAKIANATIDDAKVASLSVAKLTAGSVKVGEYIQSSNFVSGTSGWYISGSGAAEFGSASIRGQLVASQIDSRGLTIKAADGTVILSAGASLAASAYSGNVTGTINGTAAATVVDTANSASTTASAAATAASTAQTTANTAVTNASAAAAAAAAAQTAADAKLAKAGAQVLTGPVSLNAASAITVGTPALDSVVGHNGFYIGSTGIVGTKDGAATFSLDNSGNAIFKGNLTGASGTFSGSLQVGSAPAISGDTMTGAGAKINTDGTFALGNSTTNISYNGTQMSLNGNVVATANINNNAVTNTVSAFTAGFISDTSGTELTAQSAGITSTGKSIFISFTSQANGAVVSTGEGTQDVFSPAFRVYRGSTLVYGPVFSGAFSFTDTPAAGTYVYSVKFTRAFSDAIFAGSNTAVACSNRSLILLETKK
ncbi:Domain of unknown function DUF1983 [uncultured Caudovirales phage]|uniref:Tip attachment protein J central straight fiber domain-containing protein n=1 Tax=uncultured Caudovirales phage TaxID=2100421 RepID=A0A6J7WQE2_9CAUD|nr:Domain of unknown function DUF1983 [uncultured Caudovirales phage]